MKKWIAWLLTLMLVCQGACTALADVTDYVRLVGDVTPDMLCADYWLDENADQLLMLPEQIAALPDNDQIRLLKLADELNAATVRSDIQALGAKNPEEWFLNGEPVTQAYLDALMDNANVDGVPDALGIRYGYSVARASLRALPSNDFLGESAEDLFYDKLVQSECMPFLPVLVVHESKDGEWYFVWFYGFGGWVEKSSIALCPSRKDWLARQNQSSFLLVTGRELRLNVDRSCECLSGQLLPMGTRMPLLTVEEIPESVAGRQTFGSYAVKLPVRGENGMIEDVIALVAMGEDVHVGYLDYTVRNVLTQAFKLLGDRYGWGGLDASNDCSGIMREIYRCFGIELQRTASAQARGKLVSITDLTDTTTEQKTALVAELTPGSMVFFPGHIMMYLGMKENVPYVLSAVGSFATEDMEVGTVLSVNTVAVNSLLVHRRSGLTWLDSLTKLIRIGAPQP